MPANVVRYYVGTPLGAGGLARAFTDSVAQALLKADKIPVTRMHTLHCVLPYALEGWLRRELPAHGAQLLSAEHGEGVTESLQVPQANVAAFVVRVNNAGQGHVQWPGEDAAG